MALDNGLLWEESVGRNHRAGRTIRRGGDNQLLSDGPL